MRCVNAFIVLLALGACGGGGSGEAQAPSPPPPAADTCNSSSVLVNGACQPFARRIDTRADTGFMEDGQPVELEVVLFQPLEGERFPTLMFNHGSTGDGSDPALFDDTFTSKAVTRYFVDQGWMVAFPQRRGRGQSDGTYDEGFNADRSAYSCDEQPALAGAEHALADLDAAVDWLRSRADVDTTRMLVGGTSRGGILSLTHSARRPDLYLAAINFVGGWLGEGCGDYVTVNRRLFVDGATYPGASLWLYGANDSFYSLSYSRSNFDAFSAAGGVGAFHEFTRAAGLNGHYLINDPPLWGNTMDTFLAGL